MTKAKKNAWQRLCRAFFIEAHGKGHMVEFCTVNSHCRAPFPPTHGEKSLPCVTGGAWQKSDSWRPFCKRRQRDLPCVGSTHDKKLAFVVRLTKNAWQRCRLCRAPRVKRTTKELFRPAVLVTLPCASCLSHNKVIYAVIFHV
jgi:hypothetical protein